MVPGLKNGVKVCLADMSWGGWVLPIVLHNEVQCFDIGGRLPRVMFSAETLPLDQELEPPPVPATIQYLFHFPLFFSVRATGVEDSRRFLRELDEAPGGNNLHYILHSVFTSLHR